MGGLGWKVFGSVGLSGALRFRLSGKHIDFSDVELKTPGSALLHEAAATSSKTLPIDRLLGCGRRQAQSTITSFLTS